MKEIALNAAVYYFWIDCGFIDVKIILSIHDYMMKKNKSFLDLWNYVIKFDNAIR